MGEIDVAPMQALSTNQISLLGTLDIRLSSNNSDESLSLRCRSLKPPDVEPSSLQSCELGIELDGFPV